MVRRRNLEMDHSQHVTRKFMASSTSEIQKLAEWQVSALWISQLVNTMKSSIPDHRLDTAIWTSTAAQHFSPNSNDNSAVSACHIKVTRSTDFEAVELAIIWLQYRDLPQLRRRGRWTCERTLERYVHAATFLLDQNRPSKEVADRLRALAELAPRFFAEKHHRGSRQPPQPPRCNEKGREVHSVLRSGVEQRSFAHTVLPLGALLLPLCDVGRTVAPWSCISCFHYMSFCLFCSFFKYFLKFLTFFRCHAVEGKHVLLQLVGFVLTAFCWMLWIPWGMS